MKRLNQAAPGKETRVGTDFLERLFSFAPAVIYTLDPKPPYKPRFCTKNILNIMGYSAQECLETPGFWSENLHPDDRERTIEAFSTLMEKSTLLHQYRFRHKDGTWRWIEDRIHIAYDTQHQPIELVGNWIDITDRMVAQTEAEAILKSSNCGFWIVSDQGQILEVNDRYCQMSGYTQEEIKRMRIHELDALETEDDFQERSRKVWSTGTDSFETIHRGKDGILFHLSIHIYCAYSSKRAGMVAYVFLTDISERKKLELDLNESEERYRGLFLSSPDAMMTLDPDEGRFTSCNPATLKLFDVETEEAFCALSPWELSPETQENGMPSRSEAFIRIQSALELGSVFFEWKHRKFQGSNFPASVLLSRFKQRGKSYLQATVRDISRLKAAEEALRNQTKVLDSLVQDRTRELKVSQERTRQIISNAPDAVISMDKNGFITVWNEQANRIFGWDLNEVMGKNFYQTIVAPEERKIHEQEFSSFQKMDRSGMVCSQLELTGLRKDGNTFPMELSIVLTSTGETKHFNAFLRDISKRKMTENKLQISRKQTQLLLRMSNRIAEALHVEEMGLAILETTRKILSWDASWISLYNADEGIWEDLCAFDLIDGVPKLVLLDKVFPTDISDELRRRLEKGSVLILRNKAKESVEKFQLYRFRERSLSLIFVPIVLHGEFLGIISIQSYQANYYDREDVTLLEYIANQCSGAIRRIKITSELESKNNQLFSVWESSMDGMCLTTAEGTILKVNQAFARMMNVSPEKLLGQPTHCVYHPAEKEGIIKQYKKLWAQGGNLKLKRLGITLRDNQKRVFETSSSFLKGETHERLLLTVFRDITEEMKAQRASLQAQRLESLGLLAGGIAHDLNNALSPIMLGVDVLKLKHPESVSMLNTIESSIKRGSEMVRRLVTFSKRADGPREHINSAILISEIVKWIKTTFPKNIHLQVRLHHDPCPIIGSPTELYQVLLNLCVNARDAMPDGGNLSIETDLVNLERPSSLFSTEFQSGPYVEWRVIDTGCGIPDDVIDHIFDPYFTTKGPKKGTGLGLSAVVGIVFSHHGGLKVTSKPRNGTCFSIYLPQAEQKLIDNPVHDHDLPKSSDPMKPRTVLLVDDEKEILVTMKEVISRMGMAVITAIDGQSALASVETNIAIIDLVVTDMHMPNMNGLDLTRKIRKLAPRLPIIVASGLFEPSVIKAFKKLKVDNFIQKPFRLSDLKSAIEKLEVNDTGQS